MTTQAEPTGWRDIFEAVRAAMQPAEERGGPEGGEYLELMERIRNEATNRADTYRAQLHERHYTPRRPTPGELEELSEALNLSGDRQQSRDDLAQAYVAVFEHYSTGSPGYQGKLAVVVYDGAPGYFYCAVWIDGKATHQLHED